MRNVTNICRLNYTRMPRIRFM